MGFGRIFARQATLSRTARLYLAYKFFGTLFFTYPIFYEYASHSLPPVQIGMFFSAIGIVSFLLDIPSGIMADRWSRKRSAIIGALLAAGAPLAVLTGQGFTSYLLAALLYGGGRAFLSGTLESLIYDHRTVSKEVYRRINTLEISLGQAGILTSSACGGFLFTHNQQLPFVVEAIAGCITLLLIFGMQEVHKDGFTRPASTHQKHLLQSIGHLFATPYLRTVVGMGTAFSVMLGMCIQFVNESAMIQHGIPAASRGLVVSGAGIATLAILNLFLLRMLHSDSRRIIYLSCGALLAYSLMGTVWTAAFLTGYLVWCCLNATSSFVRVMIQDHIPSSHRATVLSSYKSLAILVGIAASMATAGLVQATHSPRAAYLLFSGITTVIIIPCAVWLLTHDIKQRTRTLVLSAAWSRSQN